VTGFFVTFEGGEGSGKTTQIGLLADTLRARGTDVVATREPGGSPGADAIRHIILSGAAEALGPEAETMLFAAARIDHIAAVIRPALEAGQTVLCDRFHDSTRVYQGLAGVDTGMLDTIEAATLDGLYPDMTVILDIPAAEGLKRATARRGQETADRFEREGVALHEARREAFLKIAAAEPGRCLVVDAARPPDEIAKEIAFHVLDAMERHRLAQVGRNVASALPVKPAAATAAKAAS